MLYLDTLIDRPYRRYQGDLTSYVLVNLFARARASLPVNLALLIDVSGSMEGEKLSAAKEAARLLCRQLRENDVISLLSFSSEEKVLVPAGPVAGARDRVLNEIDRLRACGVTLLLPALSAARSELARQAAGRASFAVLLTDGYPTGEDGHVDENAPPYLNEAGYFANSSVSLITVGLGDAENYNHSFLQELADRGNGRFEYSYDPTRLESFFRRQLSIMQSSSISDAEIVFDRLGGVIQRIAKVQPEVQIIPGQKRAGDVVKIGPLPENPPQSYIFEIISPGIAGLEGDETIRLCEFTINYKTAAGTGSSRGAADITYTGNPALLERTDINVAYMADLLKMADYQVKIEEGKRTGNLKLTVGALKRLAETADSLKLTQQANAARATLNKTMSGGLAAATRHDLASLNQTIRRTQAGLAEFDPRKTR